MKTNSIYILIVSFVLTVRVSAVTVETTANLNVYYPEYSKSGIKDGNVTKENPQETNNQFLAE